MSGAVGVTDGMGIDCRSKSFTRRRTTPRQPMRLFLFPMRGGFAVLILLAGGNP